MRMHQSHSRLYVFYFQSRTKFQVPFQFTCMILEWKFVPAEWEFHSERKPEWTHATCTGTKFRLGIMWTEVNKYMEMEWTRSGHSGIM